MLIRSISQFSRISARCCSSKAPGKLSKKGPTFRDFLTSSAFKAKSAQPNLKKTPEESHPYLSEEMLNGNGQKVYLDVYGCQMNVNDIEVVWSILESKGYTRCVKLMNKLMKLFISSEYLNHTTTNVRFIKLLISI